MQKLLNQLFLEEDILNYSPTVMFRGTHPVDKIISQITFRDALIRNFSKNNIF